MEFKDYYKILGVDKQATTEEITKAYRKLARKYHPDVSKEPDAEKHMREINEAREVLGDQEKRAAYDQLGSHYQSGQDFKPPPDWQNQHWDTGFEFSGGFNGAEGADFSDFFSQLFGQNARTHHSRQRHTRGEDRHAKILIELEDSYTGSTQVITLQSQVFDEHGRPSLQEHKLNVHIPKGIKEGQHIRLAGKGTAGYGSGPAGDLFLEIHFHPNPLYKIDGSDVYQTLAVTPWEAALGANIQAQTPSGTVKLTIPANSQSGRKLRLKGRGIPSKQPGDLYMVLNVVLPEAHTSKAREIYETMAKEMAFNPRQKGG